ncbi:ROK family transcriptional regulator [Georgenia deserti]|uniref:ROK family transcriptional regulator n=1 Tax=Georgenia deserti TaxID=2093781 RepID=A0ABW4L210_9MICO
MRTEVLRMVEAPRRSVERAANTRRVLAALGPQGRLTQAELGTATGLSRPTLTAILGDLGAAGWVTSGPPATDRHGAGRPARVFGVDPDAVLVAGVDVGVHTVRAVVADLTGTVRAHHETTVAAHAPGDRRLAVVQDVLLKSCHAAEVDLDRLAALCVGVPGIVDASGRIRRSTVVPDWSGRHVGHELEQWSARPVEIVNDANLAAVGEHWRGAARGTDDVVYLHVGRRTSAGLLLGGRVHTGRTGGAGEIGAIPALFVDNVKVLLGETAAADDARVPEVFAAAAAGEPTAAARVEDLASRLARSVETLAHVLDPDVMVLGGGLSRAGRLLVEAVDRHVPVVDDLMPPLRLGELADTAVTLGGVRRALLRAAGQNPQLEVLLDDAGTRVEGRVS